jgi:putative Mn2+ efflux pump MntP
MKEGIILASALTLSNISTGLAAGMLGFSLTLTTAAAFTSNVLAIVAGQKIGHYSSRYHNKGSLRNNSRSTSRLYRSL